MLAQRSELIPQRKNAGRCASGEENQNGLRIYSHVLALDGKASNLAWELLQEELDVPRRFQRDLDQVCL